MNTFKLKNLRCSVIKLNKDGIAYVDHNVKLEDSPWVDYLINKSTTKLFDSFKATQKHPDHPDDYWYPLEKFDRLVENIKKKGYINEFCNNSNIQNSWNGKDWPGGKGPIKIGPNGKIGDGHHRCCILYYFYGPEYEIQLKNFLIHNIPPKQNEKGILLVWPKHFYFKDTIRDELKTNNYTILSEQQIQVTPQFVKNLLREIHYPKSWWNENLELETKKRLSTETEIEQDLFYFIVEKKNIHQYLKGFKKKIREKYNLDKSYFHLCDPDCMEHLGQNCKCTTKPNEFEQEFNKHIHLLTNKNAIHFLTHSVYRPEHNFYKFFNEYNQILKHNDQNLSEYCIDNGGILAAYGIRDTHDIDYLTTTNTIINHSDIGCENKNHQAEYKTLELSIKDIIENDENHFWHFGLKFMSLSILKRFKFNRTHTIGTGHTHIREKDINDYKLISDLIL